jgi:hypothetical protein
MVNGGSGAGGAERLWYHGALTGMTPTRAAIYVGVASVLVAWLASAGGVSRHDAAPPGPSSRPVSTSGTDTLGDEIRQQTTVLAARLAAAPAPRSSSRNPFTFAPARAAAPAALVLAPPDGPGDPLPVTVPEPRLELIGMAERANADGVVRTAMLLADGETLLMVTVGETIGSRFRVDAVTADAVEMSDLVRGGTRRLALR